MRYREWGLGRVTDSAGIVPDERVDVGGGGGGLGKVRQPPERGSWHAKAHDPGKINQVWQTLRASLSLTHTQSSAVCTFFFSLFLLSHPQPSRQWRTRARKAA